MTGTPLPICVCTPLTSALTAHVQPPRSLPPCLYCTAYSAAVTSPTALCTHIRATVTELIQCHPPPLTTLEPHRSSVAFSEFPTRLLPSLLQKLICISTLYSGHVFVSIIPFLLLVETTWALKISVYLFIYENTPYVLPSYKDRG